MSIWAEVKKAINGTVGTQNFKPLDELYRDSRYVYACDHGLLAYSGSIHYKNTNFYAKINIPGTYSASAIFSRNSCGIWSVPRTVYSTSRSFFSLVCKLHPLAISKRQRQQKMSKHLRFINYPMVFFKLYAVTF